MEIQEGGPTLMDSQLTEEEQGELDEIMGALADLFTIPTSLPPKRSCDHHDHSNIGIENIVEVKAIQVSSHPEG